MNNPGKILLVEDDPNDVELTVMALTENHLANEIVVARDGEEALDFLYRRGAHESREAANPIVVLLDLKLPKVDGLEVLKQVKSDPDLRAIPVVMLTSSREERDLIRSYDLGTNAYVAKPVGFEELVESVKKVGLFWTVVNHPPPGSGER
ncbi:MAG TPA: response regulator [Rubrobacteraceae bacterium]|jgi:CheY-like chemotaxis protein